MDVVGVGAVAANFDAITTINGCDTSVATAAAPTPRLSTLSSSPPAPPPRTRTTDVVKVVGSEKISLPWDFSATELCRSCGKPQAELHELFENHCDDIDETNQTVIDTTSTIVDDPSVSHTNNSTVIGGDQQKSKMDIILQEMQIWQLRVSFNIFFLLFLFFDEFCN